MGEAVELVFSGDGMAECGCSSDCDLVGEEADSAVVGYESAARPDSAGDFVQVVSAETGSAVFVGKWVS